MHRNLHSPTKLTEFARDFEAEEPDTLFGKLVNRLTSAYTYNADTVTNTAPPSTLSLSHEQSSTAAEIFGRTPTDNSNPSPMHNEPSRSNSTSSGSGSAAIATLPAIAVTSDSKRSTSSSDQADDYAHRIPPESLQSSVINRIGNLMATKNDHLTSYKDTELQRFWMPDAKCKECYECSLKFTTFRRKHHCRLCGQIFCSKCCNQVVPGKIINCAGDLKVCTYCSNIVLSYLKSADINSDLRSDLQALQNDLATKLNTTGGNNATSSAVGNADLAAGQFGNTVAPNGTQMSTASPSTMYLAQRKVSVGYQEERLVSVQPKTGSRTVSSADRKQMLQQSERLKALHEQICTALPYQSTGAQLLQFIMGNTQTQAGGAGDEQQAYDVLNAMLEAGFLVAIPYRPSSLANSSDDDDDLTALMMLAEFSVLRTYRTQRMEDVMSHSGSSFLLDVDVDASSVHLSRPSLATMPESMETKDDDVYGELSVQDISFGFASSKDLEMENSVLSTAGSKPLMEAFCEHEELLLNQLIATTAIPSVWSKILLQLCAEIVNAFHPRLCGMMQLETPRRSMDIRHFVNFKKVPGGQRHESRIYGGIGFTKNVVHKDMAASIDQPRVLLLKCAIVYQRVEGKFVSIETLLLQENEYLRNVISRILQLRPNVVLVHRNVAGIAQDMLRSHGITLVLDVKLSVLERLARSLSCDIVESIDSNVGRPKLGTCHRFYTALFENSATGSRKSLIFFELQSLQRGCCVLLRGTDAELVRVKQVARMLLYARYNWRLELALLLDEFARPPSPKASIFDSKDQSPVMEENVETELGADPVDKRKSTSTAKLDRRSTELALETSKVTKENVQDFSDPLRAIDLSPGIYDQESSVKFAVETPFDNRFRTTLSTTVLSVSPFVAFPLPYLETEAGRKCALRCRFPQDLYYSEQWSSDGKIALNTVTADGSGLADASAQPIGVSFGESHEFLSHNITTSINSGELPAMWANFRASGGRLPKPMTTTGRIANREENIPTDTVVAVAAETTTAPRIDALSIVNHQRLPVLFCSFYTQPKPATTYCAPPSLLRMTFYGEQDIMLGQFLEHYCFRRSYMCPSCNLPMLSHVRRFVHSLGCVQVKLIEDERKQNCTDILMTSWCSICHSWTPSVPISVDTWCLSFAKYLEHRFHSHAYRRNTVDATTSATERCSDSEGTPVPCTHSMHRDYVHYFSHNNIVASFAYSPIECWSINLPATVRMLTTQWQRHDDAVGGPNERHADEIRELAQSGYEVFARIYERLATVAGDSDVPALTAMKQDLNRDQFAFRDRVGWVQTLLTAGRDGAASVWEVQDGMWSVKQTLAKNIEQWSVRLADATHAAGTQPSVPVANSAAGVGHQPRTSAAIDAGTICTEDLQPDSPDLTAGPPSPFIQRRTSRETDGSPIVSNQSPTKLHPNAPETSAGDKKSVKTLLRELLPSDKPTTAASCIPSPLSASEHFGLSISGRFPVTVHDQDVSSVIAFALVSHDYKRALDLRQQQLQSNVTPNASEGTGGTSIPVLQMNTPSAASPNLEGDADVRSEPQEKKRNSSAAAHIEVVFNDASTSFTCKTYFAHEFDTLRASLISDKPPPQKTNMASPSREPTIGVAGVDDLDQIRDVFARSLCRSVQWEARGGKSGSKFCKTMDDRFVLKEMSKMDVNIFEHFAPKYFEYIALCLQRDEPTLLAKIFGVYRVTIRKKDHVLEKSLLVMENLFYDNEITAKYDLKGSDRNRMVNPSEYPGEHVLLDENLIQKSWSQPLYILGHSQTILLNALIRDSSFLERNGVMDYSLLVGLNSKDKTLVLGIIDYIRTFTLDKRIESMVKKSGILGGQGKLPTVISPKQYKQRFIEAMERYFLAVPDRWEGLALQKMP